MSWIRFKKLMIGKFIFTTEKAINNSTLNLSDKDVLRALSKNKPLVMKIIKQHRDKMDEIRRANGINEIVRKNFDDKCALFYKEWWGQ